MKNLAGKHIILGVTGGIAAYKSADLVRRLIEHGAEVRVVMTQGATAFVTPLTFQAVSGNPVHEDLLDPEAEAGMGHIELARWADLVLVAPASANFIARLSHGEADDLLTTLCLATTAKLAIAPAMNQQMWQNAATQSNIALLQQRHIALLGPDSGSQACGEVGPGRMLEPLALAQYANDFFNTGSLAGVHVLITAGPTVEPIDPIRYLSNRSTGKMGYALAQAATEAGAMVTLVSGPTHLKPPRVKNFISVTTAQEMYQSVMAAVPQHQIFIGTAAVSDYRPETCATQKIKKSQEALSLSLVRNPDIIAEVAKHAIFTVGFAAETEKLLEHARAKLSKKQLNMIAANVITKDQGMGSDDNALTVIWPEGQKELTVASKYQLACQLIDLIARNYEQNSRS